MTMPADNVSASVGSF